jgi:hypothetical protein
VLDRLKGNLNADGQTIVAAEFLGISPQEIKNFLAHKTNSGG